MLTTVTGAEHLDENAVGLAPWSTVGVGGVEVTALPALHGPPGSEEVTGPVIGFVLSDDTGTVYVSGDNAAISVVKEVAERAGRPRRPRSSAPPA